MIQNVYAIKDTKSCFWKPFCQPNDLVARREFDNLVNSSNNEFMQQNYADMELYKLGTYDDANGAIESNVEFICSGSDVKKVVNE